MQFGRYTVFGEDGKPVGTEEFRSRATSQSQVRTQLQRMRLQSMAATSPQPDVPDMLDEIAETAPSG